MGNYLEDAEERLDKTVEDYSSDDSGESEE